MSKRIVFRHTQGRWAGLYRILGTTDQLLKADQTMADLPPFLPEVKMIDHVNACSLLAVKPRFVLYQELITPTSYESMSPQQQ